MKNSLNNYVKKPDVEVYVQDKKLIREQKY
jgi:hypothetical protein